MIVTKELKDTVRLLAASQAHCAIQHRTARDAVWTFGRVSALLADGFEVTSRDHVTFIRWEDAVVAQMWR